MTPDPQPAAGTFAETLEKIRQQMQGMRQHIAAREAELDTMRAEYARLLESMRTQLGGLVNGDELIAFLMRDE